MLDPVELSEHFDVFWTFQKPNDLVLTYPGAFHDGWNLPLNPNFAESINWTLRAGSQITEMIKSYDMSMKDACWDRCAHLPVLNAPFLATKYESKEEVRVAELRTQWILESRLSLVLDDIADIIKEIEDGMEEDNEREEFTILRSAVDQADPLKINELMARMALDDACLDETRNLMSDVLQMTKENEEHLLSCVWRHRLDRMKKDTMAVSAMKRMCS